MLINPNAILFSLKIWYVLFNEWNVEYIKLISSPVNVQYGFILIRNVNVIRPSLFYSATLLFMQWFFANLLAWRPSHMLCQTPGCVIFVGIPAEIICSVYSKCKHIQCQNKPKVYSVLVRKYSWTPFSIV